jgi:hypothetical protein
MKNHLIILILISGLCSCRPVIHPGPTIAAAPCEQRVAEIEHQLEAQREKTSSWGIVSGFLGVLSVVLFVIGAAIGTKARNAPRTLL